MPFSESQPAPISESGIGARQGRGMGVLEPVEEAFDEEVPATPPGTRDLLADDNSDDDLFADSNEGKTEALNHKNEFSFNNFLPEMPSKWDLEDLLGMRSLKPAWDQPHKKKKYCSGCVEDVKKDLNSLAKVVEDYRNERDSVRAENAALKKELEDLKKLLKEKEDDEKTGVKVTISNAKEKSVDVLIRNNNFQKAHGIVSKETTQNNLLGPTTRYGVQSFSISLPKEANRPVPDSFANSSAIQTANEFKSKKTVADLRREFFAKEFQSEQKTFRSLNYLEIKPQEKKDSVKSSLTIRVKPKPKIAELISKLTSKIDFSNAIPEGPKISMFQRFEKTRFVWESNLEEKVFRVSSGI